MGPDFAPLLQNTLSTEGPDFLAYDENLTNFHTFDNYGILDVRLRNSDQQIEVEISLYLMSKTLI